MMLIEINQSSTVKVQNWDKTITTIPTYAFITDSFKTGGESRRTKNQKSHLP
jgi:hypothetical protein